MTPPASDTSAAEPAKVEELSGHQIERLRQASGWARFLAVIGFVLTGLFGLGFVGLLFSRITRGSGMVRMAFILAPLLLALTAIGAVSILLWSYGRNVVSFIGRGEPALTRAFRNLRYFFTLWTLFLGLATALNVAAVLRRML